jgi:hypothetical protein
MALAQFPMNRVTGLLWLALLVIGRASEAQLLGRQLVSVNSPAEQRLRLLQIAGKAPLMPWTLRALAPRDIRRLAAADSTFRMDPRWTSGGRMRFLEWIGPDLAGTFNTAFPWGYNDGPVWAGQGMTTAMSAGFVASAGPLTVIIDPVAFTTDNGAGANRERLIPDEQNPGYIDLPRLFGEGRYTRIDPGQSTVRVDFAGAVVGISTANQHWGPATAFPFLLGNNAAGFRHLFVGTSTPANLGIARMLARVEWGRADQSKWSPKTGESRRFISGLVFSVMPDFVPGFEIGGGRFFHTTWPDTGLLSHDYLRPFEGLLKTTVARQIGSVDGDEPDNQLASMFFRWVHPRSRLEVYGEYGREDHNADVYDLIAEPDHIATYMVGFQRVMSISATAMTTLRAETLTSRPSHLDRIRQQITPYMHGPVLQGHTQLGQVLGAPGGAGGGASIISVSRVTPKREWSVGWVRLMGCGGTGGTGPCDNNALELLRTTTVGRVALTTAGSVIHRRLSLGSTQRTTGLSLSTALRVIE